MREQIAALFKEQGVTLFTVVTTIGMAFGVLLEALMPWKTINVINKGSNSGGGGSTSGGAKEWLKRKLKVPKNLLKVLSEKFGAALPGILGLIVSWVSNTLSKVVGAVAQNLWSLFVAAGLIIYEVCRKNT